MADNALRSVTLTRTGPTMFTARNARGGEITVGSPAEGTDHFSPVELLLAAVAGCSGIDIDILTSRRAEPEELTLTASAEKLRDQDGNHLGPVTVTVTARFAEGAEGDGGRERLPEAVELSRDRLCTVSRTVLLPTPVHYEID